MQGVNRPRSWLGVACAHAAAIAVLLACVAAHAQQQPEEGHETLLGVKKETQVAETGIVIWDKNDLCVTLAGLFEVEAACSYDYGRYDTGEGAVDAVLPDWHIDLDVAYRKTWEAHATLLWEEDDSEPVDLDEGWIRYIRDGFFVGGGKTYLPFGTFETFFISDPFTLEIGEMRESGVFLGYETDLFSVNAMLSNGDLSKVARPAERLELGAAALDLVPGEGVEFRLSCVSNIAEGDGFLAGALTLDPFYTHRVGGFHACAHISLDWFELVAETVIAFEPFSSKDLDADGNGRGDRPRAANFEVACSFNCKGEQKICFAAKLEGARQLADVPVRRSGVAACCEFSENVQVTLEYLYHVYDRKFTPAFRHGYSTALQLALSF